MRTKWIKIVEFFFFSRLKHKRWKRRRRNILENVVRDETLKYRKLQVQNDTHFERLILFTFFLLFDQVNLLPTRILMHQILFGWPNKQTEWSIIVIVLNIVCNGKIEFDGTDTENNGMKFTKFKLDFSLFESNISSGPPLMKEFGAVLLYLRIDTWIWQATHTYAYIRVFNHMHVLKR